MSAKLVKKAIILLSGGLDSSTTLAIAKNNNFECYVLSFDYGQKQSIELKFAQKIAKQFGVKQHKIIKLNDITGSALTDKDSSVPAYKDNNEIPTTYVPARNIIFLSYALGFAEVIEVNHIFIGVNALDYSGYPDCRPEFINSFEKTANLATKQAIMGEKMTIHTPLIDLHKHEIIKLGVSLGVDYSQTITCYQANKYGKACGICAACVLRKEGFKQAKITDPTLYQ